MEVEEEEEEEEEAFPRVHYPSPPVLIPPTTSTPLTTLPLSNLDDQPFLRFSIEYLYVYRKSVNIESLKKGLGKALVEYYPLAGRLRADGERVVVECKGEGAVFMEGWVEMEVGELKRRFLGRRFLGRVEVDGGGDGGWWTGVPPLVVQVTHMSCGGMALAMAINHCLCDGIGSVQFLKTWAHFAAKSDAEVPLSAFHSRHMLRPRWPTKPNISHPVFTPANDNSNFNIMQILLSQPLRPISVTFTANDILRLKQRCVPSLKCTSFEALASHVWRNWIRCLGVPKTLKVKLLFSTNVRERLRPQLPKKFFGNGFVLACAEATVDHLMTSNINHTIKLIQEAKKRVDDKYVRSMVDLLEARRGARPDLSASLVISPWTRLGLEDLDFGGGKPLHMGTLSSEIYCLFLPVVDDPNASTVLMSIPEAVADELEFNLKDFGRVVESGRELF